MMELPANPGRDGEPVALPDLHLRHLPTWSANLERLLEARQSSCRVTRGLCFRSRVGGAKLKFCTAHGMTSVGVHELVRAVCRIGDGHEGAPAIGGGGPVFRRHAAV